MSPFVPFRSFSPLHNFVPSIIGDILPEGFSWNPASGALLINLSTPAGGPMMPLPAIQINTGTVVGGPLGANVWSAWLKEIIAIDANNALLLSDGRVMAYSDPDPYSGAYTGPAAGPRLVKSGSNWEMTDNRGLQYTFDSSGYASRLELEGNIWTITTGGSPARVSFIQDPLGLLTTYTYDGAGKLAGIIDSANRGTSYTVDSRSNLVKRTCPEQCISELVYSTGHLPIAYVDAESKPLEFYLRQYRPANLGPKPPKMPAPPSPIIQARWPT